jgi:hypothetical protein
MVLLVPILSSFLVSACNGPNHPHLASCGQGATLVLAGDWNGATGHTDGVVIFTNTGRSSCTLRAGTPKVTLEGPDGKAIETIGGTVQPSGAAFTLAPGEAIGARVDRGNPSVVAGFVCRPATVLLMFVSSPDGTVTGGTDGFGVCLNKPDVTVEPLQRVYNLLRG